MKTIVHRKKKAIADVHHASKVLYQRYSLPILFLSLWCTSGTGEETGCPASSSFHDSWIKVGERICLQCHVDNGDAADSAFRLIDSTRLPNDQRISAAEHNCDAFARMAKQKEPDGRSRLLVKATGGLDHGGGEVLKKGSSELRILQLYVRHANRKFSATPAIDSDYQIDQSAESFFDGIEMLSNRQLLRRVTLSLAARLPTVDEQAVIEQEGFDAFDSILDEIMNEEAFYQRLQEGFNDIFLTLGYNGNGDDVLSYDHFQHTRHWYQKHSLDHIPEKERQRARYKLADQYREALRREPLELLRYIVEEERPFSEILTADYTMMSPYTARGYGQFDELKDQFIDPDDPFDYLPAKIKALKARNGEMQPTAKGVYPHAGILSTFQYLRRYPTTETNRNRLRARMYYQHFLGVDIMSLAPRVTDAAAIDAEYETPTMEAAECVVCHKTIDPIAGLFQDYYNEEGHYGPRKAGWFTDMFAAGREGEDLPESERWRSLQWLGEKTASDPRFAMAMAEHVYYILMGRKVLLRPDDIEEPHFAARRKAYLAQRDLIEKAAARFRVNNFNLKELFQEIITSHFYRADGVGASTLNPQRKVELHDIGVVRLLSPEQIERKILAVFGRPWGRLDQSYAILYGGIDSKEVTERLSDPSGAIGALQRILANDVACKNVAADFALPRKQRRLFPTIEPSTVPGDPMSEKQIRAAIVHLHEFILGREDQPEDAEVNQTFRLFEDILAAAAERGDLPTSETYFCKSGAEASPRDPDPHYTIRAWRAVISYLLRQQEFLYE